ncbi:MAG: hypothetical protein IPN18_10555 [Ignavibacteriales bacterium]|nr:hypothetical protein [Ignavibacteriales bacterium]
MKDTGLASYRKIKRVSDFNSYFWSLTAPTYIFPFYQKMQNESPGFIAVDILPQYNIEAESIKYFIKKFESSKSQYSSKKFLPILIGNSFDPEAFTLGKNSGFLITTPEKLFGKEVAELISNIKNSLENKLALIIEDDATKLSNLLSSIAKLEGKSNNIRGQLFELVVGFILYKQCGGIIEVGKNIYYDSQKVEVDVFCIVGQKQIRVVECKDIIQIIRLRKWK